MYNINSIRNKTFIIMMDPESLKLHIPMWARSEMMSRSSQPSRPGITCGKISVSGLGHTRRHAYDYKHCWCFVNIQNPPLPFCTFFSASSKRPGRWITTPLPVVRDEWCVTPGDEWSIAIGSNTGRRTSTLVIYDFIQGTWQCKKTTKKKKQSDMFTSVLLSAV